MHHHFKLYSNTNACRFNIRFVLFRYRVAEVEWVTDIPPQSDQEKADVLITEHLNCTNEFIPFLLFSHFSLRLVTAAGTDD